MYFYEFISQIEKHFNEKEYEKTIEMLHNASFVKDVDMCNVYIKTAQCYELLNDEKNAEKYYNFAKDLIDEKQYYFEYLVLNNYAEHFYKKGNYEDALTGLKIILKSNFYNFKSLMFELKIYEKTNSELFKEKLSYLFQINPFAEELIELYKSNNLNNYDDSFLINKLEELKKMSKDGNYIFNFIENISLLTEKEFDFYSNALNKVEITVDSFIIHLFNKYKNISDEKLSIYKNILSKFEKEKLNEISKIIFEKDHNGNSLVKILLQIDNEYYSEFIKNFIIESKKEYNQYTNLIKEFEFTDFHKRVFEIYFYKNKKETIKTLIGKNYEFKSKSKLFEFLNLSKNDIIAFFIESYYEITSQRKENINIENGLIYFLKNNFTEVIKQIKKLEKTKIAYFIELLWKFDKEKTFKIIFDFIQLNTKPILKRVYNIFSKYEEGFESYKSLINEEKKDIYELGIRILSKFRNDETDKLFNKLLLDENRYEFIKLIKDYFEIKILLKENLITLKEIELLESLHSEAGREKSIHIKDINVKTLPDLHFKHTNKVIDLNIILYLFKLASKTNKVIPIGKLVDYCSLIKKEDAHIFAKEVYSRWNTENKSIWFLKFVSLFANDELGNTIKNDIIAFANSLRFKYYSDFGLY